MARAYDTSSNKIRRVRFVYDIPDTLVLPPHMSPASCPVSDMYSIEVLFPTLLRESRYSSSTYTVSPSNRADTSTYYFIPQYPTCYYHHCVFTLNRTTR